MRRFSAEHIELIITLTVILLSFDQNGFTQTWSFSYDFPISNAGNIAYSIEKHPDGFLVYQQGNPGNTLKEGQMVNAILINENGEIINQTNAIGLADRNYFTGRSSCTDISDDRILCPLNYSDLNGIENNSKASLRIYNTSLNLVSAFSYEHEGYDECESAIFSPSGNIVIAGNTTNTPDTTLGAFIIKLNEDLSIDWETIVPGAPEPDLTSIYGANVINSHDGGYLLSAAERFITEFDECVFLNYKQNRVLFKFDASGELEWTKVWDNCYPEGPFNIIPTSDGNYLISTGTVVEEISNPDNVRFKLTLIKIDESGDEIWNRSYGNHNIDATLRAVIETPQGDYVAAGYKHGGPNLYRHGVLMKVNSAGDSLWLREVQHEPNFYSQLNDLILDGQGGFVACGETKIGPDPVNQDTWVVRFDSEGCVQGDCFVGVEEQRATPQLKVYPNPVLDFVTIDTPEKTIANASLEVYSITGVLVYSQIINQSRIELSVRDWDKGLFIIQMKTSQGVVRKKVIVE